MNDIKYKLRIITDRVGIFEVWNSRLSKVLYIMSCTSTVHRFHLSFTLCTRTAKHSCFPCFSLHALMTNVSHLHCSSIRKENYGNRQEPFPRLVVLP